MALSIFTRALLTLSHAVSYRLLNPSERAEYKQLFNEYFVMGGMHIDGGYADIAAHDIRYKEFVEKHITFIAMRNSSRPIDVMKKWHGERLQYEDRIRKILPVTGSKILPVIERWVRGYIYDGSNAELETRLEEIESRTRQIEAAITLMKNGLRNRVPNSIVKSSAKAMAMYQNIWDYMRVDIWKNGPIYAEANLQTVEDIFYKTRAIPSARMAYNERKKRLAKRAAQLTPRRQREIEQNTMSVLAAATDIKEPLEDTKQKILSHLGVLKTRALTDLAELPLLLESRQKNFKILQDDVSGIQSDNTEHEHELDVLRQDIQPIAEARAELVEKIKALDPQFTDDRADQIAAALALPAEKNEQDEPSVSIGPADANQDIKNYILSDDADIKTLALQIADLRDQAAPIEAQIDSLYKEEDTLAVHRKYLQKVNEKAEKKIERVSDLIVDLKAEQSQLAFRLTELQNGDVEPTANQYPPLSEFETWAKRNLNGHVIIASKAMSEIKKSPFTKIDKLYEAFSILGKEYWEQKTCKDPVAAKKLRQAFTDALTTKRLSFGPCFSFSAGRYQHAYKASVQGNEFGMDMHIVHGVSRDPRHTMRVYLTWSEAHQAVIVGYAPSHLPNRLD